tara:strand:- start:1709 stop:3520 length:1812 start_codon:yes stop_codon:yes gene_type:complete
MIKRFLIIFILFLSKINSQSIVNERAKWFISDRFGMFIHWGLYSGAEGIWKGEKVRYNNDYAEWIQYRNQIEISEYLELSKRFDWENIDPEKWVLLAKKAGMKYITITAKHHDGFALWNSESSDYNIYNYSNPKRDIIKELSLACKKHGMKLGFYYSHWTDWEHPFSWDNSKEIYWLDKKNYNIYWQEKVMPQMKELLSNYGEISLIWFDMWLHHEETIVSKEQLFQLKNLIREMQPNCLINSRLGLSIDEDKDVDFRTLGDNQLGKYKYEYPWQTPATVAHSWGYNKNENEWKSTTSILRSLIGNVSLNGNLMLNIGPTSNGSVPYEIEKRFSEIGNWLSYYGKSVYNAGAFDLRNDLHDWGLTTYKKSKNGKKYVFLNIFDNQPGDIIKFTGITESPKKIKLLSKNSKIDLKFDFNTAVTSIKIPKKLPNPYVNVVEMEFNERPKVDLNLVAKTKNGGYALNYSNAMTKKGKSIINGSKRFGSIPFNIEVKDSLILKWKVFVEKPSCYSIDTSYNFQKKITNGYLSIEVNNEEFKHKLEYSGKTVGEPNQDWMIDRFHSFRLGQIKFDSPGFYFIELKIKANPQNPIQWQWLWLDEVVDKI